MLGKFESNYIGFAIGGLLTMPSGVQADLSRANQANPLTEDDAKKIIRNAMYFGTSIVDAAGNVAANPPNPTVTDPDLEDALNNQIDYDSLVTNLATLTAAGPQLKNVLGLLSYTGGSCPATAEQKVLVSGLRALGSALDVGKLAPAFDVLATAASQKS